MKKRRKISTKKPSLMNQLQFEFPEKDLLEILRCSKIKIETEDTDPQKIPIKHIPKRVTISSIPIQMRDA